VLVDKACQNSLAEQPHQRFCFHVARGWNVPSPENAPSEARTWRWTFHWGMVMVIVAGQIDLSVGTLAGLGAVSAMAFVNRGWPLAAAFTAAIAVGMIVGFLLAEVLGAYYQNAYWDESPKAREALARARTLDDVNPPRPLRRQLVDGGVQIRPVGRHVAHLHASALLSSRGGCLCGLANPHRCPS